MPLRDPQRLDQAVSLDDDVAYEEEIAFLKDELHNADCAYNELREERDDLKEKVHELNLKLFTAGTISAFWKEAANSACDGWSSMEDRYYAALELFRDHTRLSYNHARSMRVLALLREIDEAPEGETCGS